MVHRMILNEVSYHGEGAIKKLPEEIKIRGFKKAFLCTDEVLLGCGVVDMVTSNLIENHMEYELFTDIQPNPTIQNVLDGIKKFNDSKADYLIAVGGGSVIDVAKAIGIVINNNEFSDIRSLEGAAATKYPSVPIIAIPTTAGTAAEATINYVITDTEKERKFVCVDPHSIPAVAIIDPDLMASMPPSLAAATGMDALTHAIEGFVTGSAWDLTDALHLKAIQLISDNLRKAVKGDPEGRKGTALGQYTAGMGFSNVGLGLVHSMAHALGAVYDTPHGIANAILLPAVMQYNAPVTGTKYRDIAVAMGIKGTETMNEAEFRAAAVNGVAALAEDVGIPRNLEGILKEADIKKLTELAYNDACLPGNPKEASKEDIEKIFLELL